MSELDVIVIHIRAEQAAEYERLFAERELPRWREYKERGTFISARIFRAGFGTDRRMSGRGEIGRPERDEPMQQVRVVGRRPDLQDEQGNGDGEH